MPADQIKKTQRFKRNFHCQITEKKNAIRSESVLNQNIVKVYTDGSKPNGRVGAVFYATGASPAGGQGRQCPPIYFLPLYGIFEEEKVAGFGRKKRLNL